MGVYPTSKKGEPDIEIRFNGQVPPTLVFLTNCKIIIKRNHREIKRSQGFILSIS